MYSRLLEGIFNQRNLKDFDSQVAYLKRLKDPANKLWASYRGDLAKIDYFQSETRDAYLLRYFPFYTLPLLNELTILEELGHDFSRLDPLEVTLVGCGPGPEIVSF